MSSFECKKVENCFVNSASFQYRLGFKVDDEFLNRLEKISATFKCRRDFPRPYFNATLADGTQVKGVIGDIVLKAVYPETDAVLSKEAFEQLLRLIINARNS
jgi:hypothetical protein